MPFDYRLTGKLNEKPFDWPLKEGENRLGRDFACDIHLADGSVSREHAKILVKEDQIEITDLQSRNGTWLNGLAVDEPMTVHPGDQIQLGSVVLRLHEGSTSHEGPARFEETATRMHWKDIKSEVESGAGDTKRLLKAVMEAARLVVLPQPLDKLFETMLDLVEELVASDRVLLLIRDEESGELNLKASRPRFEGNQEELPLSRTLADSVIAGQTSILVEDVPSDPQFGASHSMRAMKLNSAMAAPLFDNEKVIGLIYADTQKIALRFDQEQLRAFTMLANLIAVKITNARLLEEHREMERMEQEMAAAGAIQQRILPSSLPEIDGFELHAQLDACLQTAGDLYDVRLAGDGSVFLALGDVSGKGTGAALLMSHTMAALRVLLAEGLELAELSRRLNEAIFSSSDPTHFVTLWLGRLEPSTARLEFVNAGHNPPLVIRASGETEGLARTGMPIGMMGDAPFSSGSIELEPGDLLCAYTDGFVEAHRDKELFGEERFLEGLLSRREEPLIKLARGVSDDAREFHEEDSMDDDCTLLLLRRKR